LIAGLAAVVPQSLAAMTARMSVGGSASRAAIWRDDEAFEGALSRFATPFRRPDRRALVSLWSQYYLAALIIPTTVALLRLDRVLPVGADEMNIDIGEDGQVAHLWLTDDGHTYAAADGARFDRLLHDHLEPFRHDLRRTVRRVATRALEQCRNHPRLCGRRDHRGRDRRRAACTEARELLTCGGRDNPFVRPFRVTAGGCLQRNVCCLRYRLSNVPRCAGLCPLDRD
jgi:Uncharacterized Fe-S protein